MIDKVFSLEDLLSDSSFKAWVEGDASPQVSRKWDRWIDENPRNRFLVHKAQQKILGVDFNRSDYPEPHIEWNRLAGIIHESGKRGRWFQFRRGRWVSRIAAAILITFVTGTTFFLNLQNSGPVSEQSELHDWEYIRTEFGEQKTVDLSDGSTIVLNANSSLRYVKGWIYENSLEVHLSGEAYFSVTDRRESGLPAFRVITREGTIEVMGTKFVVNSSENVTWVVLEEGAVSIFKNGEKKQAGYENRYSMKPNQLAKFSRDNDSIKIREVANTEVFTSWKDRLLVLDSSPFFYLVQRIENIYGVNVIVHDSELYNRKLTGTIKLKELDHLTEAVSEVMETEVSLTDGAIVFGKDNTK